MGIFKKLQHHMDQIEQDQCGVRSVSKFANAHRGICKCSLGFHLNDSLYKNNFNAHTDISCFKYIQWNPQICGFHFFLTGISCSQSHEALLSAVRTSYNIWMIADIMLAVVRTYYADVLLMENGFSYIGMNCKAGSAEPGFLCETNLKL